MGNDDETLPANSPLPDDLAGTTIDQRFKIIRRLGAGGMGQVYLAEDTRLGELIALKRLKPSLQADPEYLVLLEEEARRQAQLRDKPHIASLFDIFEDRSGETFLRMEYVEGGTLLDRVRQPLRLGEFFRIAIGCCEGLRAAHEKNVVHRDIKPGNILLTPEGEVKLGDFGLARKLDVSESDAGARDTQMQGAPGTTEGFVGTAPYAAPEVGKQTGTAGWQDKESAKRSDLFSLGVVFYELLARVNPFLGGNFFEIRERVQTYAPPALPLYDPKVPRRLNAILRRAMAKDPSGRHTSVAELLSQLNRVRIWTQWKPRVLAMVGALLIAIVGSSDPMWRLLGFGSEVTTLVILPFESGTDSPEDRAYSYGFAGRVTERIGIASAPPALQVVPSSEVVDSGVRTPAEAHSAFGATRVLTASLFRDQSVVRVVYELTDAETGTLISGEEVSVPGSDPFRLEDEMVDRVLEQLGFPRQSESEPGTRIPEAEIAFTRAQGYLQDFQVAENLDRAIADFEGATVLDSTFAAAHAGLGQAHLRNYGQTMNPSSVELAREACTKALSLSPSLVASQLCAGSLYSVQGEHTKALGAYEIARNLATESVEAFIGLASSHEALGNHGAAESTYRKAIDQERLQWVSYNELGSFYFRRDRHEDALEQFDLAVGLTPSNGLVHRNRGAALVGLGRLEESRQASLTARGLRPNDHTIVSNLWMASFQLGLWDEAIENLEIAVGWRDDHRVTGNLARAYYHADRFEDARQTYERAVEHGKMLLGVNPEDPDVHILMARYYAMTEQRSEALDHLDFALERRPDSGHYHVVGATVYAVLGDMEPALDLLERAVELGQVMSEIRTSRELDDLRGLPRYRRLMDAR